jgi:phenylalanyl-tRNA synthetase beta subunit
VYFQEGEEARLALWGWGKAPLRKLDSSFAPAEALPAMVRALLQRAGTPWEEKPFLHPQGVWQRGVEVFQGETRLGTVGALNDTYLHSFGLAGQEVWAAELSEDFLRMPLRRLPHFGGLSYHPGVVKDLSLYVPDGLNYAELVAAFRKMEHPYLRDIQPFDKYTDPQGRRSYGIRFYLQADHTLTEGEIHDFLRRAIAVAEALGAQVRKAAGE